MFSPDLDLPHDASSSRYVSMSEARRGGQPFGIDVFAHGQPGFFNFGGQIYGADNVPHLLGPLVSGCNVAEIRLFSCSTARGAAGRELLASMATFSGAARVFASSSAVGHPALGATWTLDTLYERGAVRQAGSRLRSDFAPWKSSWRSFLQAPYSATQRYMIPLTASDAVTLFRAFASGSGSSTFMFTSITVGGDGAVIVYDEFEDGYEVDITNPVFVRGIGNGTTQIWGDGNVTNGFPPSFSNVANTAQRDVLRIGDVITLLTTIDSVTNPSPPLVIYGGRDRLISSLSLSVTRGGWPTNLGAVLAGAVEVYPTAFLGKEYVVPAGTGLNATLFNHASCTGAPSGGNGCQTRIQAAFSQSILLIMAVVDDVTITIRNRAGVVTKILLLDAGGTYTTLADFPLGIEYGTTVSGTSVFSLALISGQPNANYDSRWYALIPLERLSTSYVMAVGVTPNQISSTSEPVPPLDRNSPALIIYNHNAVPITVTVRFPITAAYVLTIPARTPQKVLMPANSGTIIQGAVLTSTNEFYAIMGQDLSGNAQRDWDWGSTLIGIDSLTTSAFIGYAPRKQNPTIVNGSDSDTAACRASQQCGSPVWVVSPVGITLYVDFNPTIVGPLFGPTGNSYDTILTLGALEIARIYDVSDGDMSGARLYTLDSRMIFAAQWGEDVSFTPAGVPYLDMGTAIIPFIIPTLSKTVRLVVDVNGNTFLDPGDTVLWTVSISNLQSSVVTSMTISDVLPVNVTYVPGSSSIDSIPVADDASGTAFPFDGDGSVIGGLAPQGFRTVSYRTTVNSGTPSLSALRNTATLDVNGGTVSASAEIVTGL